MTTQLQLGDITVDVEWKAIKHVHLGVYPPDGRVRISAPVRTELETIRLFAIDKLEWIKRERRKLQAQARESPREYLERESHYVRGKRYLLTVIEADAPPSVELTHQTMVLRVRPGSDAAKRRAVVDAWYRARLKAALPPLIAKWEPRLGVKVARVFVQRMKTRWGSCNHQAGNIRLNTELAKKPPACLEYIVVHEMAHLIEPSHNARFVALMDQHLPQWQTLREELNRLPIGHSDWAY